MSWSSAGTPRDMQGWASLPVNEKAEGFITLTPSCWSLWLQLCKHYALTVMAALERPAAISDALGLNSQHITTPGVRLLKESCT